MTIKMSLLFILQLCLISITPTDASQVFLLPTTKTSNKAATDALLNAVQRKDTTSDIIMALIAQGADVNANDQYGNTPLIQAAGNGLVKVCLALINEGGDINANNKYGYSPLCWATGNGHRDLCILLLRHMLLQQLLAADPDEGDIATRKLRMRCAILTLKKITFSSDLITLILKSKPLMHDYIACRYDTYCCRFPINEYQHAITKDQLCDLIGQENINALKAAMQLACNTGDDTHTALKNLLNPVSFEQHFDELFLKSLKPTMGE
jgi:ankyrin repeat protein